MSIRNFSSSHLDPATYLPPSCSCSEINPARQRKTSCCSSFSLLCWFVTEICFSSSGTCAARMCPLAPWLVFHLYCKLRPTVKSWNLFGMQAKIKKKKKKQSVAAELQSDHRSLLLFVHIEIFGVASDISEAGPWNCIHFYSFTSRFFTKMHHDWTFFFSCFLRQL